MIRPILEPGNPDLDDETAGAASLLAEEQRRAVRLLLAHPFVSDAMPDPETFALVRRHARELQRWFAEQLGYRLTVETELARLHKRPAPGARPRPLRTESGLAIEFAFSADLVSAGHL